MATLLTHCCESVSSSSLARPRNRTIPKQPLVSRDVGCWTLYRHRYRAFRQPSGVNMRETANIHEWLPATKYEVKRGSRPSTHRVMLGISSNGIFWGKILPNKVNVIPRERERGGRGKRIIVTAGDYIGTVVVRASRSEFRSSVNNHTTNYIYLRWLHHRRWGCIIRSWED